MTSYGFKSVFFFSLSSLIRGSIFILNFQTLIILRLADIPLDENTNSAPSCKNGDVCPDRAWVFAFGWSFCLLALAIFFISAIIELTRQIDYGIWNVSFR